MEKQYHPKSPVGRKRQRKSSLSAFASEPKNIKLDVPVATLTRLKSDVPHIAQSVSSKNINILEAQTKPDVKKPLTQGKSANAKIGSAGPVLIQSVKPKVESVKAKKLKNSKLIMVKLKPENTDAVLTSPKKNKNKTKTHITEGKNIKIENLDTSNDTENVNPLKKVIESPQKIMTIEEIGNRFPILHDQKLIEKFLKVPMSNNQKGRVRQAIKLSLQGMSNNLFPEVIHGKIQAILKGSVDLTDSELRRVRILYNMLKTAVEAPSELEQEKSPKKKKGKNKKKDKSKDEEVGEKQETKEQLVKKVKGPKRYVVFLGNLPLNVDKEKIMEHFREFNEHIKDIRLPKVPNGTKSAFAYVELSNEPSYELALSKHHSMLGTKRIKVLYTTQQNSKISKSEAKSKSAKLIALQKAGKLVGSTPMAKKRSHRRAIMKKAMAAKATENA